MECPKCNQGTLVKVIMKAVDQIGYVCEYCETIWFENEKILASTGHSLESYVTIPGRKSEKNAVIHQ